MAALEAEKFLAEHEADVPTSGAPEMQWTTGN